MKVRCWRSVVWAKREQLSGTDDAHAIWILGLACKHATWRPFKPKPYRNVLCDSCAHGESAALADVKKNTSNHILCRTCWDDGFRAQGREPSRPSIGFAYRTVGACCFCGTDTDDGIPYGEPSSSPRLVCGGVHAWREGVR